MAHLEMLIFFASFSVWTENCLYMVNWCLVTDHSMRLTCGLSEDKAGQGLFDLIV